jgi:glycosyltransferase involved in cell wall biosynthesis
MKKLLVQAWWKLRSLQYHALSLGRWLARRVSIYPRIGTLIQHAPRPLTQMVPPVPNPALERPRISLVTPSFNQGDFIARTLDSVLQQGYPNLEFFVQDGGSRDTTVAVLEAFSARLSGWVSAPDQGQSQAINLGFARTSGDIMGWLNSDDLLLPGALARVADYFAQHPDVDVLYGNRLLIDEADQEIGRWLLPDHDAEALSWADFIPQETLFWRRSLWNAVGGQIDESFRFAMDWDLLLRFRDAGARFAHLPHFLGAFRIHTQQKTSAVMHSVGLEEMNRLRTRTLGMVPSAEEVRRALLPFVCRHLTADLAYRWRVWTGAKA